MNLNSLYDVVHFLVKKINKFLTKNKERLDSNIESKSSNNTYLNIIEIFKKLFKKINIIQSQNLIITSIILNFFFQKLE